MLTTCSWAAFTWFWMYSFDLFTSSIFFECPKQSIMVVSSLDSALESNRSLVAFRFYLWLSGVLFHISWWWPTDNLFKMRWFQLYIIGIFTMFCFSGKFEMFESCLFPLWSSNVWILAWITLMMESCFCEEWFSELEIGFELGSFTELLMSMSFIFSENTGCA